MAENGALVQEDEAGKIVKERFKGFLQYFEFWKTVQGSHLKRRRAPANDGDDNMGGNEVDIAARNHDSADVDIDITVQQKHAFDYIAQIASMIQNNKTTLFVSTACKNGQAPPFMNAFIRTLFRVTCAASAPISLNGRLL